MAFGERWKSHCALTLTFSKVVVQIGTGTQEVLGVQIKLQQARQVDLMEGSTPEEVKLRVHFFNM